MYSIQGNTGEWEVVIGLEVHAQVASNSKLFSRAATAFGNEPNSQVSLIDAAMPGMLPVINKKCVEQAVRTGLGINAEINLESVFDRKNYFYADLPQGYQISQLYKPIVGRGHVIINMPSGEVKNIGVTRIHLEQDAGKSIHDQSPTNSFIDLNRSGIALMEIVSEPDIRSPYEAAEYLKKLRAIMRYLGTCDGDMEKGSLRCDANVSVRKSGEEFGTRCEIKNLNSIKNIMKAIEHEAERQVQIIENGGVIAQETRLFDADLGVTRTMRSKEDAPDYRYFPDPDLLPLILTKDYVEKIKSNLPELPDDKKIRYIEDLGLSDYDASVLTTDKDIADFFESVLHETKNAKLAANWITAEFFGRLNKAGTELSESKITPQKLSGLLKLIEENVISGKIAKQVFDIMFETGNEAKKIVEEQGLTQITNTKEIESIIDQVLAGSESMVAEYKAGKEKLFGSFVGQIMKATQGKANPNVVNEILKNKLKD
jgi:aspartyl-tRNA(Asn)/glutamyl-tRNA(Gln) amidotransferase subunit B